MAAPLRLALLSRAVIVLAAGGAAVVYGLLEDDWGLTGTVYVAADFLFTIVACFDALRSGLVALGVHVAVSIAWLAMAVYVAPFIAQRLASMA